MTATQGSWQTATDSAGMGMARPRRPQGTAVCWSGALSSLAWRRLIAGGDRGRRSVCWGSASPGLPRLGFTWGRGTPRSRAPSCHQRRRSCCGEGPSETAPGEENRASAHVLSGGKRNRKSLTQLFHSNMGRRLSTGRVYSSGAPWLCVEPFDCHVSLL